MNASSLSGGPGGEWADDVRTIEGLLSNAASRIHSKPRTALKPAKGAVAHARRLGDPGLLGRSLKLLGDAWAATGNHDAAIDAFHQAREATPHEDLVEIRTIDMAIASSLISTGNNATARALCTETLAAVSAEPDNTPSSSDESRTQNLLARIHTNLAHLALRDRDLVEATEHLYATLEICDEHQQHVNPTVVLEALEHIGMISMHQEDHVRALGHFNRLLEMAGALRSTSSIFSALHNIARIECSCSNYGTALEFQIKAQQVAEAELGDRELQRSLILAATLHRKLGNLEQSRVSLDRAEGMPKDMGNPAGRSELVTERGMVALEEGNEAEAIRCLDHAMTIARSAELTEQTQHIHLLLSRAYERAGNPERALAHMKEHLTLRDQDLSVITQRKIALLDLQSGLRKLETRLERTQGEVMRLIREAGQTSDVPVQETYEAPVADESDEIGSAEEHFNAVLAERYPALTPKECHICRLLREGMLSKEIAEVLETTPASVDVYRHRIRKKMGLAKETNLVSHLNAL